MNSRNAWLSLRVRLVEGVKKWEYIRGFSFPNLYLVRVEKSRNNNNKFVYIYYMPLLKKKNDAQLKQKGGKQQKKKHPNLLKKEKSCQKMFNKNIHV